MFIFGGWTHSFLIKINLTDHLAHLTLSTVSVFRVRLLLRLSRPYEHLGKCTMSHQLQTTANKNNVEWHFLTLHWAGLTYKFQGQHFFLVWSCNWMNFFQKVIKLNWEVMMCYGSWKGKNESSTLMIIIKTMR